MGTFFIQNDFSHGTLGARLLGRDDITLYRSSAKELSNVVVIPEGGTRRRFGTTYIDEFVANSNEYKLHSFQFSDTERYLLVFRDLLLDIYLDDVKVASVVTPWSGTQVNDLDIAQTTNFMVIVHPDFEPRSLERGASSAVWTLKTMAFTYVPPHDYEQNTYDTGTFLLGSTAVGSSTLSYTGPATFVFTDAFIGGIFTAKGANVDEPLGFARITARTSSTLVDVDITVAFGQASNKGRDSKVAEKAWSNVEADGSGNRGWPVSVTFYQNRLWFGGSRSLPEFLFSSQSADFFDFDTGTGLDDEAIIVSIASAEISDIRHLVADRSLQIFTTSSEWSPPQLADSALTPSTIAIRKQTNEGATNVEPVVLDNATFYVKRGGKGVMAFVFDFDNSAYNSTDISLQSQELIKNPVDMDVLSGSETEDANYVIVINEDGTLAIYQTLRVENVSAWSKANTIVQTDTTSQAGLFKRVSAVGSDIYFIVERFIDTQTKTYIEKLDFDVFMDSTNIQTFGSPTSTITGLDHLEGQQVKIRGDGLVFPDQIVVGGELVLPQEVTQSEIGLPYIPLIEMLPVVIDSQQGSTTFLPKRINRIFIRFFESLGIYINDQLIPTLRLGDTFDMNTLQPSSQPQTGIDEIYNENYDRQPEVIITQQDPVPMTILAIGYEVTV